MTEAAVSSDSPSPAARGWVRRLRWWTVPLLLAGALLVHVGAALWVSVIDDDPNFGPPSVTPRQSRTAAVAAALILREVDLHRWTANDPFFQPGWLLENMPHYQQGIISGLARFVSGMADRQGDRLGTNFDGDLHFAAGLLKYDGTIWKFASATSLMPTASAEKQYRRAAVTLKAYNARLEEGALDFDRSPQALAAALTDIAADLDASSAAVEADIAAGRWALNRHSENLFYTTKGRLYAYSLILRELGWDHAQVINDRNLGGAWKTLLGSVRTAAGMDPWMVINGAPGGSLPSHLAVQGFYLLRARAEIGEILVQLKTAG